MSREQERSIPGILGKKSIPISTSSNHWNACKVFHRRAHRTHSPLISFVFFRSASYCVRNACIDICVFRKYLTRTRITSMPNRKQYENKCPKGTAGAARGPPKHRALWKRIIQTLWHLLVIACMFVQHFGRLFSQNMEFADKTISNTLVLQKV